VVRWNLWWPYSYRRFLRSVIDPPLRSEYGVYRLNPERGDLQFLFPGYGLLSSPDHKYVAYLTSANGFSGFHNVLVYKAKEGRSTRVLSLWEADPGSGTSFSCRWSDDSRALIITGQARGWESLAAVSTDLHLAFLPETDELFDFQGQKANNAVKLWPAAYGGR